MAEARCPASCGELLQGLIQSSEKLISCPINWFSTVEVKTGKPDLQHERPMMRQALLSVLRWLEIPEKASRELAIRYDALIVPVAGIRQPDGLSFKVEVGAPIPHSDPASMMQALNDDLELLVRAHMEQWFWVHRRWKRRG